MISFRYSVVILTLAVSVLALAGCANKPQKVAHLEKPRTSFTEENEGKQVTNAAAVEVDAYNFVEIHFSPTSATLNKNAIMSLQDVVQQAKLQGNINEVIVLSWSDQEYPSAKIKKLSKSDRALAEKRNASVKKYFGSTVNVKVETYNMAQRPNTLSKWFNTTDTKLKNSLMAAGLPTTGDELQYPSKASHAVVLIKVD